MPSGPATQGAREGSSSVWCQGCALSLLDPAFPWPQMEETVLSLASPCSMVTEYSARLRGVSGGFDLWLLSLSRLLSGLQSGGALGAS